MVWHVDEYLDKTIRNLDLCPGVDVNIDTTDIDGLSVCFSLFWSKPRINLGWYPIVSIDVNNKTIFSSEGTENPEHWKDSLSAAADALARHNKKA